ncbi:MAG: EF-P lysine aminoacylase EpmA [Pseudomonadota bacterium]
MPNWQPNAGREMLVARAELLGTLRHFFLQRGVLEVSTPLLCTTGVTDPAVETLRVTEGRSLDSPRYLQSSPEYALKRLLASGSGPIYEICPAFRDGEAGARHNPEFTLLEWYRPGYDHHRLMDEVAELVSACLGDRPMRKLSYQALFLEYLDLDPFASSCAELKARAGAEIDIGGLDGDTDLWLDLLLSHLIEPQLAGSGFVFVYDYPASQAALSRIVTTDDKAIGERFELYVDGVEIANGYHELLDAEEQRRRFQADNERRQAKGQVPCPIDEGLLAALDSGLPPCSGVALGVDRLLMLATGRDDLRDVLSFDWSRC